MAPSLFVAASSAPTAGEDGVVEGVADGGWVVIWTVCTVVTGGVAELLLPCRNARNAPTPAAAITRPETTPMTRFRLPPGRAAIAPGKTAEVAGAAVAPYAAA